MPPAPRTAPSPGLESELSLPASGTTTWIAPRDRGPYLIWSDQGGGGGSQRVCREDQLSRLIDQANRGEEVVITRHGRPVARLVPAGDVQQKRKLGLLEGQGYWIADDFDDPPPDDLLDLFEGKVKEEGSEWP